MSALTPLQPTPFPFSLPHYFINWRYYKSLKALNVTLTHIHRVLIVSYFRNCFARPKEIKKFLDYGRWWARNIVLRRGSKKSFRTPAMPPQNGDSVSCEVMERCSFSMVFAVPGGKRILSL